MADARLWGLPAKQIEQLAVLLARPRHAAYTGVWPANAPIVDAFLAVCTQWRTGLGIRDGVFRLVFVGLDYAAAAAVFAATGRVLSADDWAGLQTIEIGARDALNGAGDR